MRDVTIDTLSHNVGTTTWSFDTVPTREQAIAMVDDMYAEMCFDVHKPSEWSSPLARHLDLIAHDRTNKTIELAIVHHCVATTDDDAAIVMAQSDPARDPTLVALMRQVVDAYVDDNQLFINRNNVDYVDCVVVVVVSSPSRDHITRHYGLASVDIFALYDEGGRWSET